MSTSMEDERYKLELQQIIADIQLKQAEVLRKTQEIQLAPWMVFITLLGGGAAFFAAGAAVVKVIIG